MSTHHGNGGGSIPPDGERPPDPDLPELPPEWGELSIPDDPSALAAEAEQVRAELAAEREGGSRSTRRREADGREQSLSLPLVILAVAVVITLVSLFAMTWSSVVPTGDGSGSGAEEPEARRLPAITLTDDIGDSIPLASRVPLVIMLVEECDCAELVSATTNIVPPGTTVAAVGGDTAPTVRAAREPLLLLTDPGGSVREALDLADPTPGTATVLLVDGESRIIATHEDVTSTVSFNDSLWDL